MILGILFWTVQIKWKRPKFSQAYEEGGIALGRFTRIDHDEDICPDYALIVAQLFELAFDICGSK